MSTASRTALLLGILLGIAAPKPRSIAASFGDLHPRFDFTFGDSPGIPSDVPNTTGQEVSMDGSSVKLFGTLGPIDGARFTSGFVLIWFGDFTGPISPGDTFAIDLTFDVQVTGGNLQWAAYGDMYTAVGEGTESAIIAPNYFPIPGSGQVFDVRLQSSPFTNPGQDGGFSGYLHIDWSGYSPSDTFTIVIPNSSVDIVFIPVPEPNSALLILCGGAMAAAFFCKRQRI